MTPAGEVREGDLLYVPSAGRIERSRLTAFAAWLERAGVKVSGPGGALDYDSIWRWSVEDLESFWSLFAEWAQVPFRRRPTSALEPAPGDPARPSAEGAIWLPGATLNYLDVVSRHDPRSVAVVALDEAGGREELSYGQLLGLVDDVARGLEALGVGKLDRVAAVLPNGLESVICFLATAGIGAVWSSCAPEFGASSMLDRFRQIEPKVLVTASSYRYGGRRFDLEPKMGALAGSLSGTTVTSVAELRAAGGHPAPVASGVGVAPRRLEAVEVGASHPLWILYSSGTTGLPKAIVQSHGGIVLEHLKALSLHGDLGPGERFFWFSTTGWMMWNYLVGGLLVGSTIVLYDGSPVYPDPLALWRLAAAERVTYFGTSAPYLESCRKQGLEPRSARGLDLSAIHTIGSTGAPLSPEGFAWASSAISQDVLVGSVSGGTDLCTAFLTACPWLPVHAGELQCAALGAKVEAYNEAGVPVENEVGELVLTAPMPSMPVALWGDRSGKQLHEAYFAYFPGTWRHGDWVKRTDRGSYVVYGRSDATLNRGGVRMGTAEFYRLVEAVGGVADSLVVDTSELGREGELILLVVLVPGASLEQVEPDVRRMLREQLSPRHVPDRVIAVSGLPRTLNGKKVEVPVRRILLGTPVPQAVAHDALADPGALETVLSSLREAGLL